MNNEEAFYKAIPTFGTSLSDAEIELAEKVWQAAISYMQEQSEPVAYTDGNDDFMSLQTYKYYEKLGFFNNCTIPLYTSPHRQQPLKRLDENETRRVLATIYPAQPREVYDIDVEAANAIMDEMEKLNATT